MWINKAPANIALIKYMGKSENNIPYNVSLSYTTHRFITEISLEEHPDEDVFINDLQLNSVEIERFLKHLTYIKEVSDFHGFFKVKSKNNFPRSAGIASSASSFAALTKCAFKAINTIQKKPSASIEEMSAVSRVGSGSSCRSFFSPWCVWKDNYAKKIDIPIDNLLHDIVLINREIKTVSSSDAHKRVFSSLLMNGRKKRAELRFHKLLDAFKNDNWSDVYQICWEEFFDMHALFETSRPHFGYITDKTMYALSKIRNFWKIHNNGPIATIDAGANIHLLWKKEAEQLRHIFKEEIISLSLSDIAFL